MGKADAESKGGEVVCRRAAGQGVRRACALGKLCARKRRRTKEDRPIDF